MADTPESKTGTQLDITEGATNHDPASKPISKAVALQYDREIEEAPRVLATGRGAIAEQIMQLAFDHDIKVREDTELVDILEKVDVDSPIPLEAFAAVAEILAYVYKANSDLKQPSSP